VTRRTTLIGTIVLVVGAVALWARHSSSPMVNEPLVRSAQLATPTTVEAWRAAYPSGDRPVGREAIERARSVGDAAAVRWLAELAAGDSQVGAVAGAALGGIASPGAAATLAELAAADGPVIVRANAARALGRSGGAEQVGTLATIAAGDGEPLRVRQEASLALGQIGDGTATPALAAALVRAETDLSAEGEQLRISLVQALGALGTPAARSALVRHVEQTLSPTERAFTQRALSPRVQR